VFVTGSIRQRNAALLDAATVAYAA
jgi:hypothetical protein